MTAYFLTIGDEILIGQIVDTNSAWLSQQFNLHGIEIAGKASVADDAEDIRWGLDKALEKADIVITTGGLGPTKDDITKTVLANYFDSEMVFHQPTYDFIAAYFERIKRPLPAVMNQQAMMPQKAEILPNKVGSAPAMWFEDKGKILVSLPGVPSEMKHLMQEQIFPKIKERSKGKPIAHRTLLTSGQGESTIAERIEQFVEDLPSHIKIAYLPGLAKVRLRLSGVWNGPERADGQELLEAELDGFIGELKVLLADVYYGVETTTLPEALGALLKEKNLTLGTAESCTGGHLAHLITTVPGSSAWFPGSIVAYSYELKTKLLNVSPETLMEHGAVSDECVSEMAKGLLNTIGCDIAVALSGIAGPSGGLPDKPVGTVWMAVADKNRCVAQCFSFGKGRLNNIERSSTYAMNMVRKFILNAI